MLSLRPLTALLALGALAFADPKAATEELPTPKPAAIAPAPQPEPGKPESRPAPQGQADLPPPPAPGDGGTALADGCKPGEAALTVTLLVLLRHPTDKVPPLPVEGLTLLVDGVALRSGVKVGEPAVLCTTPGEHELTARGGSFDRTVKSSAPGVVKLPIAMATQGPPPGLPPGFGPKPPPH